MPHKLLFLFGGSAAFDVVAEEFVPAAAGVIQGLLKGDRQIPVRPAGNADLPIRSEQRAEGKEIDKLATRLQSRQSILCHHQYRSAPPSFQT